MYLFVCGCPRSGTTALTRLLNLHPGIVIGLERYKGVVGHTRQITPAMLEAKSFFDFQPNQTNFAPAVNAEAAKFYERAKAKFDTAKFVGDKYPQFFRFYRAVFSNFPDAKFVFIVRDPLYVAQSWQRRADDATEWPAKNDARRAIDYWNDSLAYTLAYTQVKKNAFIFVDYEELFGRKEEALFELFRWIGADVTPEIQSQVAAAAAPEFARSEEVLARSVELPGDIRKQIEAQADRNLYQRAQRIIKSQRKA
ncbi:MAG: sulfotransferase [Enhydrobacter sp.]|nr:sulfotransferase [Enhydrobacter sp.]